MRFGERVRELRQANNLSQRALGEKVGVSFTYISKVENHKLDFGDFPSKHLIGKLAGVFGVDVDELLLLAGKIPEQVRVRVLQRPDAFRAFATCDDETLDKLMRQINQTPAKRQREGRQAR